MLNLSSLDVIVNLAESVTFIGIHLHHRSTVDAVNATGMIILPGIGGEGRGDEPLHDVQPSWTQF